ncbi:MAG: hypothetical protein JW780_01070, partial [Clostridiales bacterium]|nr:hypothetical protein [Clostridiales bacterium]
MNMKIKKLLSYLTAFAILLTLSGCSNLPAIREREPSVTNNQEIKSYEAVLSPKEITPFSSEFT